MNSNNSLPISDNYDSNEDIDIHMNQCNEKIEQEFSCEFCNTFKSKNKGATNTHKKHCKAKMLKQQQEKQSHRDIRNMFVMSAKKKKSQSKEEIDIESVVEPLSNINDDIARMSVEPNEPNEPNEPQQSLKLKCRNVLLDENNNIVEFMDSDEMVDVPCCMGAIPDPIKHLISKKSPSILKFLPLQRIDALQNKSFRIGEFGIHHKSCRGYISCSEDGKTNDRCSKYKTDQFLNKLINESMYSGNLKQKNTDMNYDALENKLEERKKLIRQLRAKIQTRERQILNSSVRIQMYQRINTSLALDNGASMVRIWRSYIKSGKSEKYLFSKVTLFLNGQYSPKSYNQDDYYRAALVLLMGSSLLLNILFNSGLFMCSKATYNKLKDDFKLSKSIITDINDLTSENVSKIIKELAKSKGIDKCDLVINFSEDEMYVDEKLESKWNEETKENEVWGTCNNHRKRFHVTVIKDQADVDTVARQLNNGEWHLCSMINVIMAGTQTIHADKNGSDIIAAIPHCNYKNHLYTKKWLKCLANVQIDDQILVKTNSTDGCSEWRLCKQELMAESGKEVDVGLHMVPKKVIDGGEGFLLSGSDQRHNFKGDFAKISKPKGVKIVDKYLTLGFVQKIGIIVSIWEPMSESQIIVNKNDWLCLIASYAKDQMNVPNPLKFFKCLDMIVIDRNLEIIKQTLPNHVELLNETAIYSHIISAYIATLMDRDASWYERLVNFSLSANGIWILFNKNGTKFCSSQLFYEKQSTAKMFYQLIHELLNNEKFEDLIEQFTLYIHYIQSQSNEDFFCTSRAMNNGPMTTLLAIATFMNASIIKRILDQKPGWKAKNYRLHGLERINMRTLIGENRLINSEGDKCDLQRAYKNGITILIGLFKKYKPDYYNKNKELFDFNMPDCNWLCTQTKDYECKPFADDDIDDEEKERNVVSEMQQAAVYDEIGQQIRAQVGLPDIETMRFPQNDIHSKISVQTSDGSTQIMGIQKYMNATFNCPRNDGSSHQKRSNDRLKAIKGISKLNKRDLNDIVLNENNDTSNIEETCVFRDIDFMTVRIKTPESKSLYFVGTPIEFSSTALNRNGKKIVYDKLNQIQLQNDKINMCLIPLKLAKMDRQGNTIKLKELMIDKNDYKYALNQTKMGNGNYIIRNISVVNGVRINPFISNGNIYFSIADLKTSVVSLKQCDPPNKTYKVSNKIIQYNISNVLGEKQIETTKNKNIKSRQNKHKNKNKNKNKNKTNDEQKEHETDEIKMQSVTFIKDKNDAAPCCICAKVIPAFQLYSHHSLHFSKVTVIKDDTGEIIESKYEMSLTITPKYKYQKTEENKLIFVEIPEAQRRPLTSDSCLICCSSTNHSHTLKPGISNPKPDSDCFLFYPYAYGNAIRSCDSSPTTNVPIKCFRCKKFRDKYLMPLHLRNDCGDYGGLCPAEYAVTTKEVQGCYDRLQSVKKMRDKTTSKWNVIVSLPNQNNITESQKKASAKYSIKPSRSKGTKRNLSNNNQNGANKKPRLF